MPDGHPYTQTDEILTVNEFARRMKVGRSTVYGWLRAGKLVEGAHFLRTPGGKIRFRWSNRVLDQLVRDGGLFPVGALGPSDLEPVAPRSEAGCRINLAYCRAAETRYPPPWDGNEPSRKEVTTKGEDDG